MPFDVDPAVLKDASAAVAERVPALEVEPVVGDFELHLGELPAPPAPAVAFLGSTIGNLEPGRARAFLRRRTPHAGATGDAFLLGTDLVKAPARLVAAYDDAQGVTAEFNRNVLRVLNRELGADFDPDAFEHVALWDAEHEWIEMRLRSTAGAARPGRGARPRGRLRRGRADAHRDLGQVPASGLVAELARRRAQVTEWWTDPAATSGSACPCPCSVRAWPSRTVLRNAERMKFFTDAVVAIAMTLLILPLLESVSAAAEEGLDTADVPRASNGSQLFAFVLSFVIIARFWYSPREALRSVERWTGSLMLLNVAWMLTIVFLPVITAMVGVMDTDRLQIVIYVGTMLVSSLILGTMTWWSVGILRPGAARSAPARVRWRARSRWCSCSRSPCSWRSSCPASATWPCCCCC